MTILVLGANTNENKLCKNILARFRHVFILLKDSFGNKSYKIRKEEHNKNIFI